MSSLLSKLINLAGNITGTLGIANGGTGQVTANAAFGALSPTTTRGDLIRQGASSPERFAAVTNNRVVRGDGTDVVLGQIDATGFFTSGSAADASNIGTVTAATQTFGGIKNNASMPSAHVTKNGSDQTYTGNNAAQTLTWVNSDSDGFAFTQNITLASNAMAVPTGAGGIYYLDCYVLVNATNILLAETWTLRVLKNGTSILADVYVTPVAANQFRMHVGGILSLAAADSMSASIQSSGNHSVSTSTISGSTAASYLSLAKLY